MCSKGAFPSPSQALHFPTSVPKVCLRAPCSSLLFAEAMFSSQGQAVHHISEVSPSVILKPGDLIPYPQTPMCLQLTGTRAAFRFLHLPLPLPQGLYMLGKCSTTEPHFQPLAFTYILSLCSPPSFDKHISLHIRRFLNIPNQGSA